MESAKVRKNRGSSYFSRKYWTSPKGGVERLVGLIDTRFVKKQLNEDYNPRGKPFARFEENGRACTIDRSNFVSHVLLIKEVWGGPPSLKRIRDKVLQSRNRKARRECAREIFMRSGKAIPLTFRSNDKE